MPMRRTGPVQTQSPIPTQRTMLTPQQKMAPTSGLIPAKQSPTPLPRTIQAATQPKGTTMPAQAQTRQMPMPAPAPIPAKPTPTPVPPPDVKAYLDRQLAQSRDKKFHMAMNGGDLALTPFHVWPQKTTGPNTTSTCIDMRSDEGRIYDIDFVTTGTQVSAIKIHKINGEALR